MDNTKEEQQQLQQASKEKIFDEFPTMIGVNQDTTYQELDSNFSLIQTKPGEASKSVPADSKNIFDEQPPENMFELTDPMDFVIEGEANKKVLDLDFESIATAGGRASAGDSRTDDSKSSSFEPLDFKSEDLIIGGKPKEDHKDDELFLGHGPADETNIVDQKYDFDDLNVSGISQGNDTQNDASLLDSLTDNFGAKEALPTSSIDSSSKASTDTTTESATASVSTIIETSMAPEVALPEQVTLPESNSEEETSLEMNLPSKEPESIEQEQDSPVSSVAQVVTVESGSVQDLPPPATEQFLESPVPETSASKSFAEPTIAPSESSANEFDQYQTASSNVAPETVVQSAVTIGQDVTTGSDDRNKNDESLDAKPVLAAHSDDNPDWTTSTSTTRLSPPGDEDDGENDSDYAGMGGSNLAKEEEGGDSTTLTGAATHRATPSPPPVDDYKDEVVLGQSGTQFANLLRTSPSPPPPTAAAAEPAIEAEQIFSKAIKVEEKEEEPDSPIKEELVESTKANSLEQQASSPAQETTTTTTTFSRPQHPSTSFATSSSPSPPAPPVANIPRPVTAAPAPPQPKTMGRKNYRRDNSSDSEPELLGNDNLREWLQIVLGACASDLLYWRDPVRTGPVFGAGLVILFALSWFSVISVIAYTLFLSLLGTLSFRVYKNILQAVQKTSEGHPFKEYLDLEITPSQERVHEVADQLLDHYNCFISKMRSVLLVEDLVDSIKYLFIFWSLTYIGAWFNGLTLVILAYIAIFSLPKVYELNKAQVDQYIDLVSAKISEISDKLPFLKKAAPAEKKDD